MNGLSWPGGVARPQPGREAKQRLIRDVPLSTSCRRLMVTADLASRDQLVTLGRDATLGQGLPHLWTLIADQNFDLSLACIVSGSRSA
jgi:hypothetical protein